MALSANKIRTLSTNRGALIPDRKMGVTLLLVIYQGAYLSHPTDGAVNPLATTQTFAGIALEAKTGGAADGDVSVQVSREGLTLANVAGATSRGNEGDIVYAVDDDTLTLTVGTNVRIGRVEQYVSGTQCWVRYHCESLQDHT